MTNEERRGIATVAGAVSQVATTAIDSLKSQPTILFLIFLNLAMFAFLYFGVSANNYRRDEHLMKVIDNCLARNRT